MKTRIYIAPFHSRLSENFPYDTGDDPSFRSSGLGRRPLTWGVCRADVRNPISPDDIVVFFSVSGDEGKIPHEYRLCAIATVEKKVSQGEIWRDNSLRRFRKYTNLLIRPGGRRTWEHLEPGFKNKHEHKDWVWRLAERCGKSKKAFERLNRLTNISRSAQVEHKRFRMASNYVVFSRRPNETLILRNPPHVAVCKENGKPEKWENNTLSREIRNRTLGAANSHNGMTRSLRTRNKQMAHRHIVWQMEAEEASRWRAGFMKLLRKRARVKRRPVARHGNLAESSRCRSKVC